MLSWSSYPSQRLSVRFMSARNRYRQYSSRISHVDTLQLIKQLETRRPYHRRASPLSLRYLPLHRPPVRDENFAVSSRSDMSRVFDDDNHNDLSNCGFGLRIAANGAIFQRFKIFCQLTQALDVFL